MRIRTTIFTIILSLLFASVLPAAQRGIKVSAKTPEGKTIPLYTNSYALVIGNGDYANGWDPLPGAIQDVKDVARALRANGFNVTLKTNLTKNAFSRAFGNFFYKYGRDKANRLLFYYAGHGFTQRMFTGEDQGYMVMVDAPAPEKDPVGFDIASIDMQVVITQAKKVKARHVLFMFDSCFSGAILNLRERVVPESISNSISLPVRQFITAGRANEPVPDHSIFKQAFLDLLEGRDKEPIPDGYITGEELGLYLKNKVPEYNSTQHPQYGKIKDILLDKGDFVFALKTPSSPKPPAPVQSSGIKNYDKIINERQADRKRWEKWQKRLEADLAKVERYDKSDALNEKEKSDAWDGLLAAYGADNPYSVKDDDYRKKAKERSLYWKGYKQSGKVFVDTAPTGARVRILNIKPKFYQGMELKPGRYHVEASKKGFETKKLWIRLDAAEDKKVSVNLDQLQTSIQPTATPIRRPSSKSNITNRDWVSEKQAKLEMENRSEQMRFEIGRAQELMHLLNFRTMEELGRKQNLIKADRQYVAYPNGIVKDTKTGLEWLAGPDKFTKIYDARLWVQSLNLDGGGWRMPTIHELAGLYKKETGSRNMTSLLKTTGWFVWSGETKGSSYARLFYFTSGYGGWIDRGGYSGYERAFAVRSRGDG